MGLLWKNLLVAGNGIGGWAEFCSGRNHVQLEQMSVATGRNFVRATEQLCRAKMVVAGTNFCAQANGCFLGRNFSVMTKVLYSAGNCDRVPKLFRGNQNFLRWHKILSVGQSGVACRRWFGATTTISTRLSGAQNI